MTGGSRQGREDMLRHTSSVKIGHAATQLGANQVEELRDQLKGVEEERDKCNKEVAKLERQHKVAATASTETRAAAAAGCRQKLDDLSNKLYKYREAGTEELAEKEKEIAEKEEELAEKEEELKVQKDKLKVQKDKLKVQEDESRLYKVTWLIAECERYGIGPLFNISVQRNAPAPAVGEPANLGEIWHPEIERMRLALARKGSWPMAKNNIALRKISDEEEEEDED
jgi:hypothetical protein